MFCHKCGATIIENASFCSACGTSASVVKAGEPQTQLRSAIRQVFTPIRPSTPVEKRSRVGPSLLVGVLLILLVIWVNSSNDRPTYSASRNEPSASQQPELPATPAKVDPAKIEETFSIGYWAYTVYSASWREWIPSLGSIESPDAAFLVIDVSACNRDRTASVLPPFKLIDRQGREYEAKSTFMQGAFDALKTLNPGVYSRGYLVFDVPRYDEYMLRASGGFESGEHRLVDLSLGIKPENQSTSVNSPPAIDSVIAVPSKAEAQTVPIEQSTGVDTPNSLPLPRSDEAEPTSKASPILAFTTYKNDRFGFTIDYPQSFVAEQTSPSSDGLTLVSPDGKAHLVMSARNNHGLALGDYERLRSVVSGQVLYREAGKDWFVIVWSNADNRGYLKMFVGNGSVNSFALTFPESWRPNYDSVVTRMEKSFTPGDTSREW
jgi:hypothetical protein